jgi:predicted lactoylglutathione lyase
MTKMIFVNLPVTDIEGAKAFYTALGFVNEPNFTDETGAAMRWSETIIVMLLTRERWKTFTTRSIPDAGSSEVMLALSFDSRAEVDRVTDTAAANGGTADVNPTQDHGFMYGRSFLDLDGHIWETFWMDAAAAQGDAPEPAPEEAHARAS